MFQLKEIRHALSTHELSAAEAKALVDRYLTVKPALLGMGVRLDDARASAHDGSWVTTYSLSFSMDQSDAVKALLSKAGIEDLTTDEDLLASSIARGMIGINEHIDKNKKLELMTRQEFIIYRGRNMREDDSARLLEMPSKTT